MVGITSVLLRPKCLGTPEARGLGMCPALRLFTVHKLRGPTPEPRQEIKCRFAKVVACYDDRDRPGADILMPNIPHQKAQIWFRSTLFEIEPGEDEETNPQCYGRQLAHWLAAALRDDGIIVAEVFPEDWGWCVMVKKSPFALWVGCGSVHDDEVQDPINFSPRGRDVFWTCIVAAEVPLLQKLLRKPDTAPEISELLERMKRLLRAAPGTELVDEP